MITHVMRNSQSKYERKTNNEQVPGGIHVSILQIRDSNSSDHSKHDHENSTNDRVWNGHKQRTKFTKHAEDQKQKGANLDHAKTSNLNRCEWKTRLDANKEIVEINLTVQ